MGCGCTSRFPSLSATRNSISNTYIIEDLFKTYLPTEDFTYNDSYSQILQYAAAGTRDGSLKFGSELRLKTCAFNYERLHLLRHIAIEYTSSLQMLLHILQQMGRSGLTKLAPLLCLGDVLLYCVISKHALISQISVLVPVGNNVPNKLILEPVKKLPNCGTFGADVTCCTQQFRWAKQQRQQASAL